MKQSTPYLLLLVLFASLLTSCTTSNKTVSSFGKRKYTKGYYLAAKENNKTVLPVSSGAEEKTTTPVSNAEQVPDNSIARVIATPIPATTIKHKTNLQRLIQATNASPIIKKTVEKMFPVDPGVPGHGTVADASDSKYDNIARAALYCALVAIFIILFSLIAPVFVAGSELQAPFAVLFYVSAIFATVFGFIGHKSEKYRKQANAGKIIGLIILIGSVVVFILLILLFLLLFH